MRRGGKYGVAPKKDRTFSGIVFDSKAEGLHWLDLKGRASRLGWTVHRQVPISMIVNGHLICKYVADFACYRPDGSHIEEVKGMATPAWRIKEKLFRALYPDTELRVFDGRGNLIAPKQRGGQRGRGKEPARRAAVRGSRQPSREY